MTADVVAPTNARIVLDDGQVIPVELVYEGIDGDGIHVWAATVVWRGRGRLVVDVLPARTGIRIMAIGPADD